MSDDETVASDEENPVEEACRVPGAAEKGICAYAGSDGKSACGVRCIWTGAR